MNNFPTSGIMHYANNSLIIEKTDSMLKKLSEYLCAVLPDKELFFKAKETVYVPDLHGDFIHLIITFFRHGLLDDSLDLYKNHTYVFLGDLYDRAPDVDAVDNWLNRQIENGVKIIRLLGNHELGFFIRNSDGYPVMKPAQDAIKDVDNGFRITESLLKNVAEGNILAAYVEVENQDINLYTHSFVIEEDFERLGLNKKSNIYDFVDKLNFKLKEYGEKAYKIYLDGKTNNHVNWLEMYNLFQEEPIFNFEQAVNEISTSFIIRRTGIPILKTFPTDIDANLPEGVHQIVGHTPVSSFNTHGNQIVKRPLIISKPETNSQIQFSDVGIGYAYAEGTFDRPKVIINKKFAMKI